MSEISVFWGRNLLHKKKVKNYIYIIIFFIKALYSNVLLKKQTKKYKYFPPGRIVLAGVSYYFLLPNRLTKLWSASSSISCRRRLLRLSCLRFAADNRKKMAKAQTAERRATEDDTMSELRHQDETRRVCLHGMKKRNS